MVEIIAYIGVGIGIVAGIITIIQFFYPVQLKRKIALFVLVIICTTASLSAWYYIEKKNEKSNIERIKSDFLKEDAEITSSAIIISGWEDYGDYIGYLTQIVGFYGRHQETYQIEYEMNKKQLEHFISFFNDKRDKKEFFYSSEWDGLKGLVKSGRDNLKKISNKRK